ncbi:hypothetical protein M3Y96_01144100 [Aphelenchoides besseyi]|nr:hypothetical protein M3Y96_01144100 [Aphelenchoides besseyi]
MAPFNKINKEEAKTVKMETFDAHVMAVGHRYKCASGEVIRVVIETEESGQTKEMTVLGFEGSIDVLESLKPDEHYRWYNLRRPIDNTEDVLFFSMGSMTRDKMVASCRHCVNGKENHTPKP